MALDIGGCLNDLWYRLGFMNASDFTGADWLSQSDLYRYADNAAQRLAHQSGMFRVYDTSVAVAPVVTMPQGHVYSVFAYIDYGTSVQILRLTTSGQLVALDSTFSVSSGPAMRLSMDANAPPTGTFYPTPPAGGTLSQVMQQAPPAVASGSSVLALPPVIADYFTYAMLRTTLARESDHAKPEVAAHISERMKLYEKAFQQYYGPGE